MSISILALQEPVAGCCVCGNRKWSLSKDEIFGRLRELAPGTAPSASPQLKTLHFNKLSCTTSQSLHQLCCDAAAKLGLHTEIEIVRLWISNIGTKINMFLKVCSSKKKTSSEMGVCLMKWPSEILQNLPYFYHKKTHISCNFIFFPNENIDQGIH